MEILFRQHNERNHNDDPWNLYRNRFGSQRFSRKSRLDTGKYWDSRRFRRDRVYGETNETSGSARVKNLTRIFLILISLFYFLNCSTPPEEPIFDYNSESKSLKENSKKRKKTLDPIEIEQICNDNEVGRKRALDAFIREKSFAAYWKKVAESRKSDAEFGRSVKRWFFTFLIGGAISLFGGLFLYVSGFGSKALESISKLLISE